jgi:hypothetical protein
MQIVIKKMQKKMCFKNYRTLFCFFPHAKTLTLIPRQDARPMRQKKEKNRVKENAAHSHRLHVLPGPPVPAAGAPQGR